MQNQLRKSSGLLICPYLALKIYHMNEEATRAEASQEHRDKCQKKLNILLEQRTDSTAIDDLLADIESGDKFMKVYKQMKTMMMN
jgi:hypothetical protein